MCHVCHIFSRSLTENCDSLCKAAQKGRLPLLGHTSKRHCIQTWMSKEFKQEMLVFLEQGPLKSLQSYLDCTCATK